MAYNSSHTGKQIDSAVGAVIEKETIWDSKQNALTGKAGQVVGFDADGNPKATDAPSGGMTEVEADKKYLTLAGGTMTGAITGGDENNVIFKTYEASSDYRGFANDSDCPVMVASVGSNKAMIRVKEDSILIRLGNTGIMVTSAGVSIQKVPTPSTNTMPTPKSYVDALKTKAHKVTLTASGWNSSTKQQTVSVKNVVADETAQLILPMPAAASMTAYNDAGIQCTAQAAGKLTFTADTVPTADISVYVTVTPVSFS